MTPEHAPALEAAAADGELWKLWYTTVPEPGGMTKYIEDALKGQRSGHMLPWVVRDLASGTIVGSTRYHDIVASDRSRRDRLDVVQREPAAHAHQHDLQAPAARARVRHARLQGGRPAHGQLQLQVAAGDRSARREEGRRDPPSLAASRRHRARLGHVQHSGGGVAGRTRHLEARLARHRRQAATSEGQPLAGSAVTSVYDLDTGDRLPALRSRYCGARHPPASRRDDQFVPNESCDNSAISLARRIVSGVVRL